jgi:hypothetical protein
MNIKGNYIQLATLFSGDVFQINGANNPRKRLLFGGVSISGFAVVLEQRLRKV